MGTERPKAFPGRSSHFCGLRALDKEIGAKDLGDLGFPWMDDNRFCCYWVWLGPHGQHRNDVFWESTGDPSMKSWVCSKVPSQMADPRN